MPHKPVLLKEVIEIFNPQPGQTYIDATVGQGGHAIEIIKHISPRGTLLGIDWDCDTIKNLSLTHCGLSSKCILVCDNYANLEKIVKEKNIKLVDGILFDLGFGTHTLEISGRGFSFLRDEPLDMRYNPESNQLTAREIINRWHVDDIEKILKTYGEEQYARYIAKGIIAERKKHPITSTKQLVAIIVENIPKRMSIHNLHPATRSFQAIRIAVNDELKNLYAVLPASLMILKSGGKIIVISFHSLEDRIVKQFLREEAHKHLEVITKKPIRPQRIEVIQNPKARSACLRAATLL